MTTPLRELIGHLEVDGPELGEGALIVDAFVIVRYLLPDHEHQHTAYTFTDGMTDATAHLGALLLVLDRLRTDARRNWTGDNP